MSTLSRRLSNPLRDRISATQAISDALRDAIVEGRLEPGEALRQDSLAQHFSVSRIPIREALKALESEGWVVFAQHKGATVRALDPDEALEIYEMRAVLECLALRHAIPAHTHQTLKRARATLLSLLREREADHHVSRNEDFHLALLAPAGRRHVLKEIEQLHRRSERYLRLKYLQPSLKLQSDAEHQALLEACEQRDVRLATSIMTKHLVGTGKLLARHLRDARSAVAAHEHHR